MITSDGMHKLGRLILAGVTVMAVSVVISINPDIDIEKITIAITPATSYILLKWTGNKSNDQSR